MNCTHEMWEICAAVPDGICPICQQVELEQLRKAHDVLKSDCAECFAQNESLREEIAKLQLALSFAGSKTCENAIGIMGQAEIVRLRSLNEELCGWLEAAINEIDNPLITTHMRATLAKAKETE